jgi:hypothetical protein
MSLLKCHCLIVIIEALFAKKKYSNAIPEKCHYWNAFVEMSLRSITLGVSLFNPHFGSIS